jgi:hypothetical protein
LKTPLKLRLTAIDFFCDFATAIGRDDYLAHCASTKTGNYHLKMSFCP